MSDIPAGYRVARVWTGPFAGARMLLTSGHSKRKILGIYEHELNPWLRRALVGTEIVWDVGANDGYFTYGTAHVLRRGGGGRVIAFEPDSKGVAVLKIPSSWDCYRGVEFEFEKHFVGNGDGSIRLEDAFAKRPYAAKARSLVKVDVEGAEVEVLQGAGALLREPHRWVVEVHGNELVDPVRKAFDSAGRKIELIENRPHWLFGPEARTIPTCWIVTRIEA